MKMIKLGKLQSDGDASQHLLDCLSGQEFPLAGIAENPYVPGEEVLDPIDFTSRLYEPNICFLVKKDHVSQVLHKASRQAFDEAKRLYASLSFLPFRRNFCNLMS